MSGSILPGFSIFAKMAIAILVLLGIEYLGVLALLFFSEALVGCGHIAFVCITPLGLLLAVLLSKMLRDKTYNLVGFVLLTFINIIYLLIPLNQFISQFLYSGESEFISLFTRTVISILDSILLLSIFLIAVFFLLKK